MSMQNLSRRTWLALLAAMGLDRRRAVRGAAPAGGGDARWLDEVRQPPADVPADLPHLRPLLVDAAGQPVETMDHWRQHREVIRSTWLDFLGLLARQEPPAPAFEVVAEDREAGVRRQLVRYAAEDGGETEAYLLGPEGWEEDEVPRPGVAVFHSTVRESIRQPAGVEGEPEKAFGLALARRGFVAVCPRNFLWPQTLGIAADEQTAAFQRRHPESRGMARMLYDARQAVSLLAALPGVDPQQLSAVGHSLGGKEVLYLAAFDERVRCTVSSEGGIGTRYCNWDAPWYLGPDIRDPAFDGEHHEVLALAAPRAFLLVGGDGSDGARSWPFIEAVLPVWDLYGARNRLGLYNHRQGHAVPPEAERRIAEWIEVHGRTA